MQRLTLIFGLVVVLAGACPARTIELTSFDLTQAAVIDASAPRLSWAGHGLPLTSRREGFLTSTYAELVAGRSMLASFDLSKLPTGVRITSAEWVLPRMYHTPREVKFYIYRIAASWGPGVCHEYRTTRPEKVAWTEPGARSPGADRALSPSAVIQITREEPEVRVNVTADVELWYKGVAPNYGWLVTIEEVVQVRFGSPIWNDRTGWKLRITYEPQ